MHVALEAELGPLRNESKTEAGSPLHWPPAPGPQLLGCRTPRCGQSGKVSSERLHRAAVYTEPRQLHSLLPQHFALSLLPAYLLFLLPNKTMLLSFTSQTTGQQSLTHTGPLFHLLP